MISTELFGIYEGISAPDGDSTTTPLFAVRLVPGYECYFVGKDPVGQACLLVETMDETDRKPPPIRLENLDAQFEIACQITVTERQAREGLFSVVQCRSLDLETIRYFLSVCWIIMRHLGETPSCTDLAAAVLRIALMFQNIKKPPTRSLNGLFGELFFISRCRSPARAVAAWRVGETSRFDFAVGDIRMDVKSCAGRVRIHTFSYDQCNPPPNTHGVVASLMVERIPGGISIGDLITSIEARISGANDLVLKLYEIIASTLGTDLSCSISVTFDSRLAESSLQFFDLREIPAVRGSLPDRVTNVQFSADLSGLVPLSKKYLVDRDPYFWELIPQSKLD